MMKNILMKKSIIIAICALTFFSVLATIYTNYLSKNLYDETDEYLQEITIQTASSINHKIDENITQLKTISELVKQKQLKKEEIINYLDQLTQQRSEIKRFGIADKNGNAITSDHQTFNIQYREYFQKSLKGESSSSSTLIDYVDSLPINVYSVPLYNQSQEVTGVLFATFYTDKFSKTLSQASFNNTGYSLIFNEEGEIILTASQKEQTHIQKLSDLSSDSSIDINKIDFKGSGIMKFKDESHKDNYLVYANIKNNDWLVASIFPKEIVTEKIQQIIHTAFITWLLIGAGSAALITYIYFIQKKNKYQVDKLAYEDPITHHYNFNKFVELCQNQKQLTHYLLINCDIKGFKWFNEIYGEDIANELLITIIETLDNFCQDKELCCRVTDDHFALLLQTNSQVQQRLLDLSHTIRNQFNKKYTTSNFFFHYGIYEIDKENIDIRTAFKKTQYIKNTFKELSKDDIVFYKEEQFLKDLNAQQYEHHFHNSLENQDFKVYIQPKVNLKNGYITSGEALVRWLHPEQGLISPGQFIPIFEKNGMLEELDTYILEKILETLEKWNQVYQRKICISINVSRTYIFNEGYIDKLLDCMNRYQVDPQQIEIEITETTALNHKEELITILNKLKKHHLRIALDDFGSGYSSLNMLKDFPIDVVKIDQEFFRTNTYTQMRSHIIIEEVIELCHKLNIEVVAEGVETLEQNEFLFNNHCDYIQGYYYYKPLPIQEFEKLILKK